MSLILFSTITYWLLIRMALTMRLASDMTDIAILIWHLYDNISGFD